MHLASHITHSNGYAPYIAYYRSNGFDQRFRKLKPKPKLNPPNAHRSQIKICEKRQTQNVQFRFMPNAFRILKPIQKSSKRVWVFRNTGANAFAKNQMRLANEDKRDLYCICPTIKICAFFGYLWGPVWHLNNHTGPILLSSYLLTYINIHVKYGSNLIWIFQVIALTMKFLETWRWMWRRIDTKP